MSNQFENKKKHKATHGNYYKKPSRKALSELTSIYANCFIDLRKQEEKK